MALSLEQAAAIGIAYLAASLGVIEYTQLAAGETLLVAGRAAESEPRRHTSANGAARAPLESIDTNSRLNLRQPPPSTTFSPSKARLSTKLSAVRLAVVEHR